MQNKKPSTQKLKSIQPSTSSKSNRHDTTLSGRTRKRIREEQDSAYLEHPYTLKLQTRKSKLRELLNKIFALADNDVIVCDRETGLNDYTKNLKFADELEDIAKHLIGLSQECTRKAALIRKRIDDAKEDKRLVQDIVYMQEIIKESEKDEYFKLRKKEPVRFVKTSEFPVKREHAFFVDDPAEEPHEADKTHYSGDPDTKFAFPKQNDNDELKHVNTICIECDKTLRDAQELCNHISNHRKEIYRCLKCKKRFRTERSYEAHAKMHTGDRFTCDFCSDAFDLKSTLSNHLFTHSQERMVCKKCQKEFKFRSSYLEHIRYRHRSSKSVECPICHKMFWTPTGMCSHRYKIHGSVGHLLYGEEKKNNIQKKKTK